MSTYFEILTNLMEQISLQPYFILPPKQAVVWLRQLRKVVSSFDISFSKENIKQIKNLKQIVLEAYINEYRLVQNLLEFLENYSSSKYVNLESILKMIKNRSYNFWLAEEVASKKCRSLAVVEIFKHDQKILAKDLQLYGLDYFLMANKIFENSNEEESNNLITNGYQKLPGLKQDAEDDDILNKVVYHLWSLPTKIKMIQDYYVYREVLTQVNVDLVEVKKATRVYCLTLLEILINYKVDIINQGLYLPYGKIDVTELKKIL